jgi:hypothetical protein
LDHTLFDRYDARGWVRVNVLTADLSTPGLKLDYASPGKVSHTAPLTKALQRDHAVARRLRGPGYDVRGFGTWVEPRDIRLSYDRQKLSVRRGRGFSVKAQKASTSDVTRVTAGGRTTHIGVTSGLARTLVDRMNGPAGWSPSSYPARAGARLSPAPGRR